MARFGGEQRKSRLGGPRTEQDMDVLTESALAHIARIVEAARRLTPVTSR
jgi:hypothetical protein